MSDINWSLNTINIVQQKTQLTLILPLIDQVKYPLLDYLKNVRKEIKLISIIMKTIHDGELVSLIRKYLVSGVMENAILATIPSHFSKEAIDSAVLVALIIYLARKNYSKREIIQKLNLDYHYIPFTKFNTTCLQTLNNCFYALFTANDFVSAIKKVISYGGDTDTNACIVGSMAEAFYDIPQHLIIEAQLKIPYSFTQMIEEGYTRIRKF